MDDSPLTPNASEAGEKRTKCRLPAGSDGALHRLCRELLTELMGPEESVGTDADVARQGLCDPQVHPGATVDVRHAGEHCVWYRECLSVASSPHHSEQSLPQGSCSLSLSFFLSFSLSLSLSVESCLGFG